MNCRSVLLAYHLPHANSNATTYIKQKRLAESILDPTYDIIIRPSLVIPSRNDKRFFKLFNSFVPIPKNMNRIAPMTADALNEFLISYLAEKNIKGQILLIGSKKITLKSFLEKTMHLNAIHFPSSFWFLIIFLSSFLSFNRIFLLRERLQGFINLRDIDDLEKEAKRTFVVEERT